MVPIPASTRARSLTSRSRTGLLTDHCVRPRGASPTSLTPNFFKAETFCVLYPPRS